MGITKQIRAKRREAAEARQAEYNKLPLEQKIARAGAKEKAKLVARSQK